MGLPIAVAHAKPWNPPDSYQARDHRDIAFDQLQHAPRVTVCLLAYLSLFRECDGLLIIFTLNSQALKKKSVLNLHVKVWLYICSPKSVR